ncbi:DDE-type integrase/transposase/recombinase [Blastococcus mobilis]|uniref:Integrase core domain-containing protein n=1 Tax=Blastococcus mobilis TaxID=1938746 RepID=A0A238WVN4_9ACTN|nr:DDE-type integrase/transposase/recombinase [Blastococcus mobilis]SNR50503.1 Integrase core domain-containing protein [Blastococcus mobilis]
MQLTEAGLDAGADTIGWHLTHHHQRTLSRATIHRVLTRAGQVNPDPGKRPTASYLRFAAEMPNGTWQSDFTHYRLTTGATTQSITWLDDHSRYALHVSAHPRITGPITAATFTQATTEHGYPAATLTDGCVTLRVAGRLHHMGVGRTLTGTDVLLLVQDLHIRVIHAATGELHRDLILDPRAGYQPTGRPPGPARK